MIQLGVNIDHVATLRQARKTRYPSPVQAALLADNQRARAMKAVEGVQHDGLQSLFTFLSATLLD